MITPTATEAGISAPDTLSALQGAWTHVQSQEPEAPPAPTASSAPRLSLRQSFLNLRDIPQIAFEDARGAFPMLASAYPAEWKEQTRQLRNRLTNAQAELHAGDECLQVLAFTNMDGSRPRHGTTANLGLAMASMQDTRVLIVDANLSSPTLHTALRIPAGPGLCEATRAERVAMPPCFRRVAGTQVYFLTIGETMTLSMDPLDLRGLHTLLQSLRTQFDWILIDGPGFDTPADAMAITMAADGVVIVIESERDSFREVARALGQVQGRRMLGAVMF